MYLLLLIVQAAAVCHWPPHALALPAAAVEPDYDALPPPPLPGAVRFDPHALDDAPDTFTYRTIRGGDATPEKLVFRDTTPDDNLYPWEEEVGGDSDASTAQGADDSVQTTTISYAMEDKGSPTGAVVQQHETKMDATAAGTTTDAPSGDIEQQLNGVVYRLYTRAHPIKEMVLQADSLQGTDFDVGRATVFVIHGFTGDATSESVTLVRDALLWAQDANVVVVDWAPLAAGPHYERAVNNTRVVAEALAARIASLLAQGLPLARLHLLGFSLGAQVAGLTGGAMHDMGRRIPRITALDPARPGFHDAPASRRLDAGDAEAVVVLHTASGLVSFEEPLGHADFYANNGRSPQPACVGQSVHVVCSHLIAPRYFAESIYKPQNFRSTRCGSWRDFVAGLCAGGEVAFLGPDTPSSTRGTFYFRTNPSEPYGRGAEVDDALGERQTPPPITQEGDNDDADAANRLDANRSPRKHDPSASASQSNSAHAPSRAASAATTHALVIVLGMLLLQQRSWPRGLCCVAASLVHRSVAAGH